MTQPREKNLYDVLEVSSRASPETIRAAYKSLLQRYHPDKHPGDPKLAALAKEMIGAFQVLSDPKARAAYDRKLSAARRREEATAASTSQPSTTAPAAPSQHGGMRRFVFIWVGAPLLLVLLGAAWLLRSESVKPPDNSSIHEAAPSNDNPPSTHPAEADAQTAAAQIAGQRMKDWLLAYRRMDPSARVAEVTRLVNNGTLPVLQGYGRFFADPAELRQSSPGLVQGPASLGREDAAALDDLQSWWFAPGQLNLLVFNNISPKRSIVGFIFELAANGCVAGKSIGAIAVQLGAGTVEPGEAALLRITVPDMHRDVPLSEMCGTIVSGLYGSPQSTNPPRPKSAEDQEYDALLAQAELAHPELDPATRQFSQASTNWVAARVEIYVGQNRSRTQALRMALDDYQASRR